MERINNRKTFTLSLLTLVSCVMLAGGAAAETPNITPLECKLQRKTPVSQFVGSQLLENGLEAFTYDTNSDGQFDAQLIVPQGDENRYPVFYMFDNDYDGQPDVTWVDRTRDGTCKGIELYWFGAQKDQV